MSIFISDSKHTSKAFQRDASTAILNGFTYIQSAIDNKLGFLKPELPEAPVFFPVEPENEYNLFAEAFSGNSLTADQLPQSVLDFMEQDIVEPEPESEYTEPGDADYCIACDIKSKIYGIILARLNTDKAIDLAVSQNLLVLSQLAKDI